MSAQFEMATDFGNLLRANTPVSRMMTTYTRRGPGQSYLKNSLAVKINEIIEDRTTDLEINPLKIYEQIIREYEDRGEECPLARGVTADEAGQHVEVIRRMQPRLNELMRIAESFLEAIIATKDQVPYGIRWICKQIRSLTKVRSACSLMVVYV